MGGEESVKYEYINDARNRLLKRTHEHQFLTTTGESSQLV